MPQVEAFSVVVALAGENVCEALSEYFATVAQLKICINISVTKMTCLLTYNVCI